MGTQVEQRNSPAQSEPELGQVKPVLADRKTEQWSQYKTLSGLSRFHRLKER